MGYANMYCNIARQLDWCSFSLGIGAKYKAENSRDEQVFHAVLSYDEIGYGYGYGFAL